MGFSTQWNVNKQEYQPMLNYRGAIAENAKYGKSLYDCDLLMKGVFPIVAKGTLYVGTFFASSIQDKIVAGSCKLHPASITLGSITMAVSLLDFGNMVYKMRTDEEYVKDLSKWGFWGRTGAVAFNVIFYSIHFAVCD